MIALPIPTQPYLPCYCSASVDVLPFLIGRPMDAVSWGWLESLRPSSIRVSYGEVKCDSRAWRVTVILSQKMLIESITQEVELRSDDLNGHEMLEAVK